MPRVSKDAAIRELHRRNPLLWRGSLEVNGKQWADLLCPVQIADFNAIDKALLHLAFPKEFPRSKQRFWIQRSRGYSKSTDFASCMLWLALFSKKRLTGVVVADDREQAQFVRDAMSDLIRGNPEVFADVDLQRKVLVSKTNGCEFSFASSDTTSAFGGRPDLTIADELTHWKKPDFWTATISSYGKRADDGAVLLVGCNAGAGRGWQWDVKCEAMTSELWYHHAPAGHSPWYSDDMLQEQRHLLTWNEYCRYWRNEWQDSTGTFVTLSEADACIDHSLAYRESAAQIPRLDSGKEVDTFVVALDYAEKHDRTVGTVCHLVGTHVVVDRMDVVTPELFEGGVVPPEWCRTWVMGVYEKFGPPAGCMTFFIIDPHQLVWLLHELRAVPEFHSHVEEWEHQGGNGSFELSRTLRSLILNKQISWYPDCGVIMDQYGRPYSPKGMRDDLSTELSTLFVKELSNKRWRLDHPRGEHDDRAFSLGAACSFIAKYSRQGTAE